MTAAGFYHCSVKSIGRANGRSIVAAAAYRNGERLTDERTGEVFDYRARGGVLDTFILASADVPAWVQNRERLWNGAERAEPRANGRLATELELALPHELTDAQRKQLVTDFLAPIIERYGVAADVAIHAPGKEGDHRNIHAHVLVTNRRLDDEGFIEKVKGQRKDIGLSGFAMGSEAVLEIRQAWEQHVNRAYELAGLDIRVDHRSHAERGIEQEPTKHLGPEAAGMERRGIASELGDLNREIMQRNAAREAVRALEQERRAVNAEIIDLQAERAMRAAREAAKGRTDEIILDRSAEIDHQAELAMQTARAAAQGRKDEIRPNRYAEIDRQAEQAMQGAHAAAKGRTDDIRPASHEAVNQNIREPMPPPKVAPEYARETVRHDPPPEIKPLGQTAGEIRLAWQLTATADQFAQALEDKGLILVHISREEAEASHRAHAFAKAVDRQSRELKEGFAVVDQRGNVTRIDQRTTGDQLEEIQKRLGGIDTHELVSVADAREIMREANRAAWIDQQRAAQEQARPANWIESRIAEIADRARIGGADAYIDSKGRLAGRAEVLADQFKPADEQQIHAIRVYGSTAFETRLDESGITIARVTDADIKALAALHHDESMARIAAETNNEAYKPRHFAADLVAGDLAAVTRAGDVYQINPDKTGDAKQHLAGDLPSVVEARAHFEQEREQISALWNEQRADIATARADFAAEREASHQASETARTVHQVNREVGEAVHTGERAAGGFMRGLSSMAESFIETLSNILFPPPPPTRDQAERMARSAEEQATDQAWRDAAARRDADHEFLLREIERSRQSADQAPTAAELYGTPKPRTKEQEKEQERDYGREL